MNGNYCSIAMNSRCGDLLSLTSAYSTAVSDGYEGTEQEWLKEHLFSDAPSDGKRYVRSNGEWVEAIGKYDLFIDMWNSECGVDGSYNPESGFFELNGITDIGYEEALSIYQHYNFNNIYTGAGGYNKIGRTNIPYSGLTTNPLVLPRNWFTHSSMEKIVVSSTDGALRVFTCSDIYILSQNQNLTSLTGLYSTASFSSELSICHECPNLETFNLTGLNANLNLSQFDKLSGDSITYIVNNAGTKDKIITVSETTYTKITSDTFSEAVNKNTTIAVE